MSPVMLLVKLPVSVPSLVLLLEMVGLEVVPQHTPRAVTLAPPSELMFPPLVAVVWVIELAEVVVRVGGLMISDSLMQRTELPDAR